MAEDRWEVRVEEVNHYRWGWMKSLVVYDGDEQLFFHGWTEDGERRLHDLVDHANHGWHGREHLRPQTDASVR